jgi:two-component system, chemotaxis family, response regulator Rcp1
MPNDMAPMRNEILSLKRKLIYMQEIHILLVDDNEGDILLTREALEEAKIVNKISIAYDGMEAIGFLQSGGTVSTRADAAAGSVGTAGVRGGGLKMGMPDLILLDINLPKMDGQEVLAIIKNDPELRRIPVIMLTTSSSEKDILASYDNHANCYITKPVDLDRFMDVVRTIEDFWISIVKLPKTLQ